MVNQKKVTKAIQKGIVVVMFPLLFCTSCTRYATKGEQLYLQSKNGDTLKLPPHFSKSDEENQHLYELMPQTKKNPVVSVLPPGREDTQHA